MRRMIPVALATAVLTIVVLTGALEVAAGGFLQEIQGNWVVASVVNEKDGKKTDVFGADPKGSMILTPDGRYSIILMRSDLPKFAANNRVQGTAQENEAVVKGSVAYFGTYKAESEAERTVSLAIEGCTFPNWSGEIQKRVMTVTGDEMKLTNPTAAIGGTNYLIWKRAK
ncbi:MAG TPA: lipocalin-like domain-containing protein [Candidatus Methanoperedens sp.]|nr:lipocalin-like domain-containing protein [Candidatus Methanoperedens sp.]